jgi:hypothetical protein
MSNKSKLVSSTHEIFSGWKLLESIHTSLNDYPIFNKNAQTNNSRKQKSRKTKDRVTRFYHRITINHQQLMYPKQIV